MTSRKTIRDVPLKHSVFLRACRRILPPGTYRIEVREPNSPRKGERLDPSPRSYRPAKAYLLLPDPAPTDDTAVPIDIFGLDAALRRDQAAAASGLLPAEKQSGEDLDSGKTDGVVYLE